MSLPHSLAAVILFSTAAFAQEHELIFSRPLTEGTKFDYRGSFTNEENQTIELNGNPARQQGKKSEASIAGRLEITAVSKHRLTQKVKLTLSEWSLKVDGQRVPGLKKGDVIEGVAGKSSRFTIGGSPVSSEAATVLRCMVTLKRDDEPDNDDAMLGPGHKVNIGESWKINPELAAKDLTESLGLPIKTSMVRGVMSLTGAVEEAGLPCLRVATHITLNGTGLPISGAPEGMTAKMFVMSVDISGKLPNDVTKQQLDSNEEVLSDIRGESTIKRDGVANILGFNLSSKTVKHWEMKPVEAAK